ncbi:hypothetical protein Bca101_058355 [Brassica carinata]
MNPNQIHMYCDFSLLIRIRRSDNGAEVPVQLLLKEMDSKMRLVVIMRDFLGFVISDFCFQSNPSLKMFLMMRFSEFIYARIRRSENGAEVPVELLLLCIPPQILLYMIFNGKQL